MSAVIEFCPGRVHVFKQGDGNEGEGFYKLDPKIDVGSGGKVLIMGAPIELREIVQPVVTLDSKRILYTFGSAWTEAVVQVKVLLGESSSSGESLGALQKWYEKNRVSKKNKEPVKISIATAAHQGYLVGMRIGQADSNYNTQDASMTFMLSDD